MNINEKHFDLAMNKLEQRRTYNSAQQQHRHREVCDKLPRYAECEKFLAETSGKLIALMLNAGKNSAEHLKQLEEGNLALQHEMKDLLTKAGYPEDYLKPIYTCPVCQDKGIADNKWCECFKKLMLNAAAEEINDISPLKLSSFACFDLSYYSDEPDKNIGISPREVMRRNLAYCIDYAKDFSTDSDSIYMNGGTGLGKTHLSLAIADAVIRKGYNVIYGSTPEFLRQLEREYYGRAETDTMASLSRCDLLILDDLGAEMEKPVYTSLLYELINSRISRGLPMIISSNLGMNELRQRYQDRICSRIISFETLMFIGQDVRRKLKK